jgi:hypothetical protein
MPIHDYIIIDGVRASNVKVTPAYPENDGIIGKVSIEFEAGDIYIRSNCPNNMKLVSTPEPPPLCIAPSIDPLTPIDDLRSLGGHFLYMVNVLGTQPFTLTLGERPLGMEVSIDEDELMIYGSIGNLDYTIPVEVNFTIKNCNNQNSVNFVAKIYKQLPTI